MLARASIASLLSTASILVPRRLVAMSGDGAAASAVSASCFCGAVGIAVDTASGPPMSSSICHCETCRRLSGGPMMATIMYPKAAVTLTNEGGGELSETKTSKHVRRLRCPKCSSPVLAELGGGRVGVPLSLFSRPLPDGWDPQCHLW